MMELLTGVLCYYVTTYVEIKGFVAISLKRQKTKGELT